MNSSVIFNLANVLSNFILNRHKDESLILTTSEGKLFHGLIMLYNALLHNNYYIKVTFSMQCAVKRSGCLCYGTVRYMLNLLKGMVI